MHPARSPLVRLPRTLLAAVALLLPHTAIALSELYVIDPNQSFVTIAAGSGATLDFGGGPIELPFGSQVGALAGVSGNALPGIGLSNGLTTSLSGQVQVDYQPNFRIRLLSGATYVIPDDSGTWAPGAPDDLGAPGAAQGGVAFGGALNIAGAAALRDAAFNFGTGVQPLSNRGSGVFGFASFSAVSVIDGAFDYQTNLFGLDGRGHLDGGDVFVGLHDGEIAELGGGANRVTLPFAFDVVLDSFDLGGFPIEVTLALEGRIVAFNREVPEPACALLVGSGLALIGAAARRHAHREGADRA